MTLTNNKTNTKIGEFCNETNLMAVSNMKAKRKKRKLLLFRMTQHDTAEVQLNSF